MTVTYDFHYPLTAVQAARLPQSSPAGFLATMRARIVLDQRAIAAPFPAHCYGTTDYPGSVEAQLRPLRTAEIVYDLNAGRLIAHLTERPVWEPAVTEHLIDHLYAARTGRSPLSPPAPAQHPIDTARETDLLVMAADDEATIIPTGDGWMVLTPDYDLDATGCRSQPEALATLLTRVRDHYRAYPAERVEEWLSGGRRRRLPAPVSPTGSGGWPDCP